MNKYLSTCFLNSFGFVPKSAIVGLYGNSVELFEELQIFFRISQWNIWGFLFFHILNSTCYFVIFVFVFLKFKSFYYNHPGKSAVASQCGSHMYFLDNQWCWTSFSYACWPGVYLLWRNVYSGSFTHFWIGLFVFFVFKL